MLQFHREAVSVLQEFPGELDFTVFYLDDGVVGGSNLSLNDGNISLNDGTLCLNDGTLSLNYVNLSIK